MSEATPPTRTVRDIAGLLALVPSLLGHQPTDSLVIVCMKGSLVELTVRLDLDPVLREDTIVKLLPALRRSETTAVVLAGYRDPIDDGLADVLKELATDVEVVHLLDAGRHIAVVDAVMVGAERWRSIWEEGDHDVAGLRYHAARAQDVLDGRAPARSRAELAARLEPGSEPGGDTFFLAAEAAMLAGLDTSGEGLVETVSGFLDVYERERVAPDDAVLGALVALASFDAGLSAALRRLDRDNAHHWFKLWSTALRRVSGMAAWAPAVLAGSAAFLTGDGATMNIAHEHAAGRRPDHWATRLLLRINQEALSPAAWERLLTDALPGRGE